VVIQNNSPVSILVVITHQFIQMKQAFLKIGIACMLSSCLRMVDAFAAGNKGKKGNKTVVGKGFGISSKQPSLEEVVAKFPNRIPDNAEECECPCGSDKVYRRCCGPFHKKEKLPSSPIDVLRSRYSAFAVSHHLKLCCEHLIF
jgi:hypothetical protein